MLSPDRFKALGFTCYRLPQLQNFLHAAAQFATIQLVALHPSQMVTSIRRLCIISLRGTLQLRQVNQEGGGTIF